MRATIHKHTWIRSSRKHRRPPRFFVRCKDPACGVEMQAIMTDGGYVHVFTTGKKGETEPMKNYSLRLPRRPDEYEMKVIRRYLIMRPGK